MEKYRLLQRAKSLKIISAGAVEGLFAGNYRSAFKGPGIEFDEVRAYTENDDARFIDWNVSSRLGTPFLKTFKEERELVLFLIIDVSPSLISGAGATNKREAAGIISGLLAYAAVYNNDRAGALFFSDRIEKVVPPMKGKSHVLRLVQDISNLKPEGIGSNLSLALRTAQESLKRRGICIIISDFRTNSGLKEMALLAHKHDVIALRIKDKLDTRYPSSGLFELRDTETERIIYGQGYSKNFREDYKFFGEAQEKIWVSACRKRGVEPLTISTEDDPLQRLAGFFSRRKERR